MDLPQNYGGGKWQLVCNPQIHFTVHFSHATIIVTISLIAKKLGYAWGSNWFLAKICKTTRSLLF